MVNDFFDPEQITSLKRPLDPGAVSQREGSGGRKLSYIEGHYAIDQANSIFGYGNWGHEITGRECKELEDGTHLYTATVRVWTRGASGANHHEDIGVGLARPSSKTGKLTPEDHEKGIKEAVTDALKRALRVYGDQFGNSLYDKDNEIHQQVRSGQHSHAQPPRDTMTEKKAAGPLSDEMTEIARKIASIIGHTPTKSEFIGWYKELDLGTPEGWGDMDAEGFRKILTNLESIR
jgi:DNA repair and recombination protein RAD52